MEKLEKLKSFVLGHVLIKNMEVDSIDLVEKGSTEDVDSYYAVVNVKTSYSRTLPIVFITGFRGNKTQFCGPITTTILKPLT